MTMNLLTIIKNGQRQTVEIKDCEMCEGIGEIVAPWEGLHNKGSCPYCHGDGIVEVEYYSCTINTETAKKRAKRYYEKINQN